jgi:hypothetical protein
LNSKSRMARVCLMWSLANRICRRWTEKAITSLLSVTSNEKLWPIKRFWWKRCLASPTLQPPTLASVGQIALRPISATF